MRTSTVCGQTPSILNPAPPIHQVFHRDFLGCGSSCAKCLSPRSFHFRSQTSRLFVLSAGARLSSRLPLPVQATQPPVCHNQSRPRPRCSGHCLNLLRYPNRSSAEICWRHLFPPGQTPAEIHRILQITVCREPRMCVSLVELRLLSLGSHLAHRVWMSTAPPL